MISYEIIMRGQGTSEGQDTFALHLFHPKDGHSLVSSQTDSGTVEI